MTWPQSHAVTMYNKLFGKILDSTIWLAPDTHRLVWITLIAAMDEDGLARFGAVENLAARARVPVKAAASAVTAFEGPDPHGMNQEHEGRRIERVPDGWLVLNAQKYRDIVTKAVSRERTKERTARWRARKRPGDGTVTPRDDRVTPSYSEAVSTASESERKNALLKNLPDLTRHTPAQRDRIARTKT